MSSEIKEKELIEDNFDQKEFNEDYFFRAKSSNHLLDEKKVNVRDLVNRLHLEKKKQKKNNLILSAAAVSALAVFGVILTL